MGRGAIESLARQAALYGRRALVVTGKSSLAGSGHRDQILASLQEQGLEIEIMSGVNPEPGLEEVGEGIRRLKECRAQLVIGIGGGSTIDVGKAVAALAGQSRPPEDYFYGREPEQRGCPFLAVPTTSGSGSEVTPNSVLTHEGKKQSVRGPYMWPVAAVVDPELTVSMPPAVTAHSGFDALTHAVEAYTSRGANPLTDLYALEAVKRIMAGLPETFKNGEHRPARESMSLAALLAGVALANARLGAVHGLAHAVGGGFRQAPRPGLRGPAPPRDGLQYEDFPRPVRLPPGCRRTPGGRRRRGGGKVYRAGNRLAAGASPPPAPARPGGEAGAF